MKQTVESRIRTKKIAIAIMEYVVTLGCLLVAFVMMTGKDRIKQVNSYAKPEDVSRYVVEDEYLTRVRPLTEYSVFKEIAENSLNKEIIVYRDATKTEEVTSGVITSGMVVEAEDAGEVVIPTENSSYEIRVVGDITGNGDSNVTELTKIIRHIVGKERLETRGEEISADFNGDGRIDVVDITLSIRYIVYGELPADEEEVRAPEISARKIDEEEERENNWYNGNVEVKITERERKEGEIEKTETTIEKYIEGSRIPRHETTEEQEIILTEEARYVIKSQSYGANGTRSKVTEKEINIDKTTPVLNISREDVDRTQCKIIIQASDKGGIRKYSIAREGEEERSREGIDEKELNGYITIRENGRYIITVEDKAGNRAEQEIEINNLNNRYKVIFKNEDNSVINQREYNEGERAEVPQNPSKAEDERNTYEFAGWKTTNEEGQEIIVTPEEISSESVTKNKEYTATYTATLKNYTVTFKDEDGGVIKTKEDYNYGDTIEAEEVPQNPSKQEDETNIYEFIGWKTRNSQGEEVILTREEIVSSNVEGNKQYTAVYETTRKEYTIIFRDESKSEIEEGRILSEKTDYQYGEKIAVPQNPSKAEDERNTYEFAGWKTTNEEGQEIIVTPEQISSESVTKNKEYTATYTATLKNYTVTFKDEDGGVIKTKEDYNYGDTIEAEEVPQNPSKQEDETNTYEFVGWKTRNSQGEEVILTREEIVSSNVEGNKQYTAVYEVTRKEYTIIFRDEAKSESEEGRILSEKTDYHYGEKIAVPQNPSKAEDERNTYEFAGWKTTNEEEQEIIVTPEQISSESVTKNKEYIATYEATLKDYTVIFKDDNGREISKRTDYHYGDTVTIPENPSKAEDETNTYEFVGWDKEVSTVVEGNVEYKAIYEATRKEYTVTFKDEDGTVLTNKTDYHYGERVAIPQNPTKPEDNTYIYEFTGWNPEVEETVTGNKEYIATYTSTYKNYTVTFKDDNGREISKRTDYHYGDTVVIPENPSKAEDETYIYEFKGWTPEIQTTEESELKVTGNIEYTATYEAKYKEYTITFKQDTGEVLSNLGYHYGTTVELPDDPHKLSTMEYAYTFKGWNRVEAQGVQVPVTKEEITTTPVTKELEYIATYEAEKINYSLEFYNDDYNEETGEGTLIDRSTYNYGEIIEFPEAIKEETEEIKYVFDSWENLGTEEKSATEIEIKFKAKYKEEYYVARLEQIVQEVTTTNEETGETVTEEQVVLEGKSYLTLKEAIEEAGRTPRTIRMLKDTEESALVEDDQNITLNLNGKTITAKKIYVIKNYGELKIVNNSDNEGKILEISEEDIGYGIYNRDGKVSIESGTIAAEARGENAEAYAIYNQSESPLNITGGSVIAEAKGANSSSAGIYNLAGREINVTGGLVYGNAIGEGTNTYGIYNQTEGKVEVTGGIIQAKASLASATSYGIYNKISEDVIFNGGQIVVQSDRNKAYGIYNEEGKVKLGEIITTTEIDETTGEEQEVTEEQKGTISVTASEGYGVYNDRGTIEENTATITMVGSTSYGIYNNEGTVNANKGEITSTSTTTYGIYNQSGAINLQNQTIEMTSSTAYGIYNKNEASINGVIINNRNNGSNTYGIYNEANQNINIQNVEITGGNNGIYSTNGNITINEANIITAQGIITSNDNNNKTITVEKANIVATNYGINNNAGTIILKDVTINSNSYGIYTNSRGTTEIGVKDGIIDTERPYIYGKTKAVYIDPSVTGNIKYYDGKLQGQSVIYGGISDIETNSEIKIVTIENEGRTEEVAILQQIEERDIARIGETTYTTLAEAVAAVPENQETPTTIEIIADSAISTVIEIPANKNVIIDLKGHTLTTYAKGGIINRGTLEIIDTQVENNEQQEPTQGNNTMKALKESALNKTLKLAENETGEGATEGQTTIGTIESKVGIGITNEGILVLTGGKIISNNDGIYNNNNGQVTLHGAIIETIGTGISNNSSNYNSTINVISGEIKSQKTVIYNGLGTINISGGKVENSNNNYIGISGRKGALNITGGIVKTSISGFRNINISGGEIKSLTTNSHAIASDGTIEISGGKIESANIGIMSWTGTINVTGGKIISEYAAISSGSSNERGANIIIGNKNTEISDNPIIIGKTYGIKEATVSTCRIEYYNGIIKGKEDAIYGSISDVRDGKEINESTEIIDDEEYKVASLVDERVYEEPIAQIGENTYTTVSRLKDAILEIPTYVEDATEVKVLNDFSLLETLEIKNMQKVKIDLNGKTITSSSAILNQGQLEITDSTEEYMGKIKDIKITAIKSRGTTTITKGNIEGIEYAIMPFNYTRIILGEKDGEVDDNQVLIKSVTGQGIKEDSSSTIKMYDGKLIGKTGNARYINEVEEGYKVYTYRENGYIITALQIEDPVARIGETEYYSLQTAIDECEAGQTIELLRTIEKQNQTLTVAEGKEIKIDLKGYTVTSNLDKMIENNGILKIENSSGTIQNTKPDGITVENNGELYLNKGTISGTGTQGKAVINTGTININGGGISETSTLGTAIQNKGTVNVTNGNITADTNAIENLENGKINITGGIISSYYYGIYNESIEDIEITGGTIQLNHKSMDNSLYGIYNNTDAGISINNANIRSSNNSGTSYEQYVYGIYNEANGEVIIGEQTRIDLGKIKYNYGIYNKGNGNVTTEGTIGVNGEYLAYGIRNAGQGEVKVTGGNITSNSLEGTAYGIENGAFGGLEVTNGSITANTTSGTSYGIYNISTKIIKVKDGNVKATGEKSFGIYSNTADIEIGENDEEIKTTPIIEGDNKGLYVNTPDTKFKFYDGKIIGKQAINVEAIIPEEAKIIRHYNEETQIETLMVMNKNNYIITFYNDEDKTQIVEQKLFKSTDTEIEEPQIPEISGYIGYWHEYEIGEHDIETWMCYAEHREDGTKIISQPDENGFRWNYTYNNGEATDVYYESGDIEGNDGIVNIPVRVDGYPVVDLYRPYGSGNIFVKSYSGTNTTVKQIKIPNSVTSIGSFAFSGCTGLTRIEIPNSVTSIGNSAFYKCTGLTSIEIPNSVTNIGNSAFCGCTGLTSIEIPNSVTSIGGSAFEGCTGLTSIEIPNSVTSIGNSTFYGCTGLTEVEMPNVTSIGRGAFRGCSSLTEVEMPNVTIIEDTAFRDCSNLISVVALNLIEISDALPYTSGAFHGCTKLEYINMPNIKIIGECAFQACTSLTNIDIPNVTSIGNLAFTRCTSLTSIEIPKSLTSIKSSAFSDCENITNIKVDNDNLIYDSRKNCNAIIKRETNELELGCKATIIPNSVTSIGGYAFSGCVGLKNIDIPNSVTSIGNGAFSGCTGLTSINIPISVTSIGYNAFYNWTIDQTIYIEANSKPDGWDSYWNSSCNANIVWGYKGE